MRRRASTVAFCLPPRPRRLVRRRRTRVLWVGMKDASPTVGLQPEARATPDLEDQRSEMLDDWPTRQADAVLAKYKEDLQIQEWSAAERDMLPSIRKRLVIHFTRYREILQRKRPNKPLADAEMPEVPLPSFHEHRDLRLQAQPHKRRAREAGAHRSVGRVKGRRGSSWDRSGCVLQTAIAEYSDPWMRTLRLGPEAMWDLPAVVAPPEWDTQDDVPRGPLVAERCGMPAEDWPTRQAVMVLASYDRQVNDFTPAEKQELPTIKKAYVNFFTDYLDMWQSQQPGRPPSEGPEASGGWGYSHGYLQQADPPETLRVIGPHADVMRYGGCLSTCKAPLLLLEKFAGDEHQLPDIAMPPPDGDRHRRDGVVWVECEEGWYQERF